MKEQIRDFDRFVDIKFDRLRGRPVADRIFYTASELGEFGLIWMLFAALRAVRSRQGQGVARRVVTGMAIESVLINGVVKSLFRRRRPVWQTEHPLPLRRPRTSSFPSGHATSAFTGAMLLSENDPLWPVYFVVAPVVAFSRVYVRAHHASDVVAGIAIGVGLGIVGRRVLPLSPVSSSENEV
ncbi:MAG TPA: phosphatase PAP2 family protein [Acidimicrobiales bacterium]|nr:phosphatase PAP2 family protein [Acidimicrobiales bacterium]